MSGFYLLLLFMIFLCFSYFYKQFVPYLYLEMSFELTLRNGV